MARYFFHLKDGLTVLDEDGTEFANVQSARNEAVRFSAEVLTEGAHESLWTGQPWLVWVTDQPNGNGTTFFTLHFSATQGDGVSSQAPSSP